MQPKLLTKNDMAEDQLGAMDMILSFISSPGQQEMMVEGPAGTGKTSMIRATIQQLPAEVRERCIVCAPTNKAVKVARELSGGLVETTTIFKFLGLSPQPNGEVKEIKQSDSDFVHKRMLSYDIVVMDEGSMGGSALRPYIQRAMMDYGIKFIYIGDRYQLPPVGEPLSFTFETRANVRLTKVKRHDNAILNLATHIRDVLDNGGKGLVIEENWSEQEGGVRLLKSKRGFDAEIVEHWTQIKESGEMDFSGSRILAWRNARVNAYNELIRELIYGRREARQAGLMQGERVVVCNPVTSLQDKTVTLMHTDEEGFVESIEVAPHPDYPEIECYKMVIRREMNNARCGVYAPTERGWRIANRQLDKLKSLAMNKDRTFWGAFWALKEKLNDVRPCHALTTHRSQGSTFRNTYVDLDDILMNDNRIESLKSAYVAITRASHTVTVLWKGF